MSGWIKLYRKIASNPVFNDLELYRLWSICLLSATHSRREQTVGRQVVMLEPGQFVTGRFELMDAYNRGLKQKNKVSDATIWRWLKQLETRDCVTIESNNKYSVVSVVNWAIYQGDDSENEQQIEQQNEQQMNSKRTANEQLVNTNKNVKNVKKGKKEDQKSPPRQRKAFAEDSPPFKMAVYLHGRIMAFAEGIGKAHLVRDADMQKWADDCRKILELDKRDPHEAKSVIDWATSDTFWQQNILSPGKLREKYTDLALKMASAPKVKAGKGNDRHFERNKLEAQKIMEAEERERIRDQATLLEN